MSESNENRRSFRQKSQSPEMTRRSKENHKEDRLSRSFLREARRDEPKSMRQSNSSALVSPVRLSSRSTSSKRSENDSRRSKELSPRPEKQREHRSSASLSSKQSKKSFDTTDDSESDSDASEIFAKRSSARSSTSRILDDKQLDLIDVRRFEKMKINEKEDLKRENIWNLCQIVFKASSSSASISYLVSMIREINEHHQKQLVDSMPTILGEQPIISYESAFNNLIRDRNDGIFCIALHAALISSQDKKGLRRLGEDLNIDRKEFDVASLLKSSGAFQQLLTILEERKINERKRFLRISPRQLPYKGETTVRLNPSLCSLPFDVVKIGVDLSGFQVKPNSNFTSDLIWSDGVPSGRVVAGLKAFQKLNRFIGTKEFIDRNFFLKVYRKMSSLLPEFYDFLPRSWDAVDDYILWFHELNSTKKNAKKKFLLKSFDSRSEPKIKAIRKTETFEPKAGFFIQEFIPNPCLINGFKFSLQIYVLISSCDPLRCYVFNDGIAYLSPAKYFFDEENHILNSRVHLVSQSSASKFVADLTEDFQYCRSLEFLIAYLHKKGRNIEDLWVKIQDVARKTVLLAEPFLFDEYRKARPSSRNENESVCFEILALNLLIDDQLKPWLIDIDSESIFDTKNQTEFNIKAKVILDAVHLLNFQANDRKESAMVEEETKKRQLCLLLGKEIRRSENFHFDARIFDLTSRLERLRQDLGRDQFEKVNRRGFLRLFPVKNIDRMNESMEILQLLFENFTRRENQTLWREKLTFLDDEKLLESQIESLRREIDIRPKSAEKIRMTRKEIPTQTESEVKRSIDRTTTNNKTRRTRPTFFGLVDDARRENRGTFPGVAAVKIVEKKFYGNSEENRQKSPVRRDEIAENEKTQIVRPGLILRATQNDEETKNKVFEVKKNFRLDEEDFDRLNALILDELKCLTMKHPHFTEREIDRFFNEIEQNWEEHRPKIRRLWLVEIDSAKREQIVEIAWKKVRKCVEKTCLVGQVAEILPLNRNLLILKRRSLANKGHSFWQFCEGNDDSWKNLFTKSSHRVSDVEIQCFYRFLDLCRETLLILYRCSIDENRKLVENSLIF